MYYQGDWEAAAFKLTVRWKWLWLGIAIFVLIVLLGIIAQAITTRGT